jgi:hypothetical protein
VIRNMRGMVFAVSAGTSSAREVNSRIRQLATAASGAVCATRRRPSERPRDIRRICAG